MPVVRQAIAQWRRWVGGLPAWAIPAVFGVVISLCLLGLYQYQHAPAPSWEILWNGHRFTDSELGPMLRAFAKEDLTNYAVNNGRIRVPHRDASRYLAALAEHEALPRGFGSNVQSALAESRWFETERDRRRRVSNALDQDLASQIRAMPGIEDAMVYCDHQEERGFQAKTVHSASVSVVPANEYVLSREQIHAIRVLVASARPGLEPSDVSVTDLGTSRAYAGAAENVALMPRAEDYLLLKKRVERDWSEKVRSVLQFVPSALIVVDADLPVDELPVGTPIGQSIEPRRLAVSVGIPESFYRQVWRGRLPLAQRDVQMPTADDLRQLRAQYEVLVHDAIAALLPGRDEQASSVAVTTFDEIPVATAPTWGEWRHWGTSIPAPPAAWLIAIVGGTLVLLVLRRLGQAHRRQPLEPATLPFSDYVPQTTNAAAGMLDPALELDEVQLREALAKLVRDDPDGAARVLHRWLERAG
jgi:flagellar biosynthesis/type III secretory pathway M-ring protein FliF/YscJ